MRKYLSIDKKITLSSIKEVEGSGVKCVELDLPIIRYWQANAMIKYYNYLLSNKVSSIEIDDIRQKIVHLLTPYAVFENDRRWLYHQFKPTP